MKRKTKGILLAVLALAAAACFAACGEKIDYNTVIPEGSFSITAPADGATDVPTTPEISWTKEKNAEAYHVEIAADADFKTVESENTVSELRWTVAYPLSHSAKYYLRITALKTEEGKNIALSRKTGSFTTAAEHSTETPDYTKARTIYDFEDFENSEALNDVFYMHAAGDSVAIDLVNEGVDGSKAMKVTYATGVNGWAGALSSLSAEKKVWSGAKGIRMWVHGDASGMEVEVRFGKRGYQSWNATFKVNSSEPTYVSIPFTAFADAGGGDGIFDLSGITRLWFFFKSTRPAEIVIDDISIGSDENYTVDTREAIETSKKAELGVFDDFETYADGAALNAVWTVESGTADIVSEGAYGGAKSVRFVPSAAWATFGKSMPYTDFTDVTAITFKASGGLYVVQLISGYNVIEKEVSASRDGETIGVNLSELRPQNSSMVYQLTDIDLLRIGIKDRSGSVVMIDDVVLSGEEYVPEDHSAGLIEDFESEDFDFASSFALTGEAAPSVVTENPLGGARSLKLDCSNPVGLEFTGYNLVGMDFTSAIGFRFGVKMNQSGKILVQIGSYGNVYTYEKEFYGAGNNISSMVCDFSAMKLRGDSAGELDKTKINFLRIDVTTYGEYVLLLDDMRFYGADEAKESLLIDDFSDYGSDAELQAKWNSDNVVLGAGGSMKMTSASGWNGLQYNFAAAGGIGSADDYQNCYGVRLKLNAGAAAKLTVKLTRWDNSKEVTLDVAAGENAVTVYFCDMEGNAWSDMIFNSLTLGITYYGEAVFEFDDVEFLRG